MRLILKPSAFDKLITNDLLKKKQTDKIIYMKNNMHIGFESEQIMPELIVMDVVPVSKARTFKQSFWEMINVKSPPDSPFITDSSIFNPQSVMSLSKNSLQKKMKTLLH